MTRPARAGSAERLRHYRAARVMCSDPDWGILASSARFAVAKVKPDMNRETRNSRSDAAGTSCGYDELSSCWEEQRCTRSYWFSRWSSGHLSLPSLSAHRQMYVVRSNCSGVRAARPPPRFHQSHDLRWLVPELDLSARRASGRLPGFVIRSAASSTHWLRDATPVKSEKRRVRTSLGPHQE